MPPEPFASTFRHPRLLARTNRADLWAAVDVVGNAVHVVQLSPAAAADTDARAVLAGVASGAELPGGAPVPVYGADLTGAQPWVAALAQGGGSPVDVLIGALGLDRTTALPPWAPPVRRPARGELGGAALASIVLAAVSSPFRRAGSRTNWSACSRPGSRQRRPPCRRSSTTC